MRQRRKRAAEKGRRLSSLSLNECFQLQQQLLQKKKRKAHRRLILILILILMDALNSSSASTFSGRCCRRFGFGSFPDPRADSLKRFPNLYKLDSGLSVSRRSILLQQKLTRSLTSSPPHTLCSESEVDAEIGDTQVQATDQTKTVHVKFQLQKACQFGQHFFIVGEDPMFGLWEPSNALAMDWSDGHVWSIELDIPVEKTIQFKFILKGTTGEIEWQPGPDRILCTWETSKTIVVLEDWGNADLQKITEEGPLVNLQEVSVVLTEESMVNPSEELVADPTEESTVQTEKSMVKMIEELVTSQITESLIANNIGENNGNATTDYSSKHMKDKEILILNEGVPVLVSGLVPPVPELKIEEGTPEVVSNGMVVDASVPTDEASNGMVVDASVPTDEASNGMVADAPVATNEVSDCYTPELLEKQEPEPSIENSPTQEKTVMTCNEVPKEKYCNSVPEANAQGGEPEESISDRHDEVPKEKYCNNVVPEANAQGGEPEESISDRHDEKPQSTEKPAVEVLRNDIHWSRRVLHNFFFTLGFSRESA